MATVAGQYITDGTAIFILRDTRDGTPVGRPVSDDILRDSYVRRNGALLQRGSYPTLVKFLQDNPTLVTTEANWPNSKNLWTWGDGTSTTGTTIRVPDDRGQYEQLSDSMGLVAAGLPNILGEFSGVGMLYASCTGALSAYSTQGAYGGGGGGLFGVMNFNASKSSPIYGSSTTVTPPTIKRISQMKY